MRTQRDSTRLTLFQLRRLAYQASRNKGSREVLLDALLIRFPSLEREIRTAEKYASEDERSYVIMFRPEALNRNWDPDFGSQFAIYREQSHVKFPSRAYGIPIYRTKNQAQYLDALPRKRPRIDKW